MDQLAALRAFREIVESGSFTQAAARLDLSAPMVSKRLAQLERRLNARLLHRSSRHLSLTEAGSLYYEQCRHVLDTLDAANAALGRIARGARGQLKISAPVWCANARFTQALAEYRRRFPDVILDMYLTNRHVDLVSEGFDVALRATHEPSPSLIAKPLCLIHFRLVASPAFVQRYSHTNSSTNPMPLDIVVPNYLDMEALIANPPKGLPRLHLNVVMRSDDTTLTYHAVRAGMGAAYLPEWLVSADLAAQSLIPLMPETDVSTTNTLFAVFTSRRYMAPKLRTFVDFMVETAGGW